MGSERKPSKKKMGMMVKGALFMCLLQAVLGKHIYPVPDPYRWDESFTVELPRIDDEHRGLFNAILLIERDNTKEHLTDAYIKYRDWSCLGRLPVTGPALMRSLAAWRASSELLTAGTACAWC